jgi:hypothetical protein
MAIQKNHGDWARRKDRDGGGGAASAWAPMPGCWVSVILSLLADMVTFALKGAGAALSAGFHASRQ